MNKELSEFEKETVDDWSHCTYQINIWVDEKYHSEKIEKQYKGYFYELSACDNNVIMSSQHFGSGFLSHMNKKISNSSELAKGIIKGIDTLFKLKKISLEEALAIEGTENLVYEINSDYKGRMCNAGENEKDIAMTDNNPLSTASSDGTFTISRNLKNNELIDILKNLSSELASYVHKK